ncbi:hypothetical protein OSTOST_10103 [Ostertagia ostertagi]
MGDIKSQIGETVSLPYRPVHICLDQAGRHCLVAYNEPPGLSIYKRRSLEDAPFGFTQRRIEIFSSPSGISSLPPAYISLERPNELHVCRCGPEGFDAELLSRQTTLFGGASKTFQFCGTVRIYPNGRFVYVANRILGWYNDNGQKMLAKGGDDIAVFVLDAITNQLNPIQRIDSEGVMPGTISFENNAEMLVLANPFEMDALDGDEMEHIAQSLFSKSHNFSA